MTIRTSDTFYTINAPYCRGEKAPERRLRQRAQAAELRAAGLSGDYKTKAGAEEALAAAKKAGKLTFEPEINETFLMGF